MISSIFWCFFILSRFCYITLSMFVKPMKLVIFFVLTLAFGGIIMLICGTHSFALLMLGLFGISFGSSPISGLALSWPSKYFQYSGKQTSMIFLIGLAGESLHPIILGHFFDDNPSIYVYYLGALSTTFALLFAAIPVLCKILFSEEISEVQETIDLELRRESILSPTITNSGSRRNTVVSLRIG